MCYHCDEKWNPTHVCKKPKVYVLHGKETLSEDFVLQEGSEDETIMGEKVSNEDESMKISIHALLGCINNNSMKLLGRIGESSVEILVDSRSTQLPRSTSNQGS